MGDTFYNQNIQHLQNIFGKTLVAERADRLTEIYLSTEKSWNINLDRFKDKKVENILIAEAAPWSESGIPRYFYNKIESNYHLRIWRTFFPCTNVPTDVEKSYNMLIDKNFMLVDTVPYSMKYLPKDRRHPSYLEIIADSLNWWNDKINNEKILLSENVNIAFAFNLNGKAIIHATKGILKLKNGQTIKLTNNLIAADGSGYTNSKMLRRIYKI